MYEQFLADPSSVSESWRDFFADYRREGDASTPGNGSAATTAEVEPKPAAAPKPAAETEPAEPKPAEPAAAPAAPAPAPATTLEPKDDGATAAPIRGAAARIAANMEASLAVPTATSFREVPAKLLEVNRRVINGYLGRTRGGKVSFTHIIGDRADDGVADDVREGH